uniref:CYP3082A3 n=1 Tax=Eurytemora affinis TaxID=88015 RepID=A0A8B0MFP9_EURAF|nr:CYP3082A3 [Eurytemora affinis]
MLSWILFTILLCILSFLYLNKPKVLGTRMPGPKGALACGREMGSMRLGKVPFLGFHQLSMKWGNILSLDLVVQKMVILAGFQEIKLVHSSEHADSRAPLIIPNLIFVGSHATRGILFNSGQAWRDLRRFTIKSLKDLGFNKSASEDTVLVETNALVSEIRGQAKLKDGVVDIDLLFNKAALNIVWKFVSNQRYEYDDHRMHKLLKVLDTFMTIGTHVMGKPLGILPFLRFFPPFRQTFNNCYNGIKELRDFIQESIDDHVKKFDKDDIKDYIDVFLNELGTQEHFTIEQLVICCLDLFTAGSETSSKGLMFGIALMIRNPGIQSRVQEELDLHLQGRKVVTMEDKVHLPYTEATINEVFRLCNVVPVVAPHLATKDIQLGQYTLSKGTTVLTNTYSVHMDPEHFKDPHTFNPDRFINQKGEFENDERNIPFGIGKRRCLGETLARMENFLFFSNLLLQFRFLPSGDLPSLEPVTGFSNGPQPFLTKVLDR